MYLQENRDLSFKTNDVYLKKGQVELILSLCFLKCNVHKNNLVGDLLRHGLFGPANSFQFSRSKVGPKKLHHPLSS